jgi:photosynthetic reaction center cytochrome c subunit
MIKRWMKLAGALTLAVGALAGCERPPIEAVQWGYRGTGMEHVTNPRITAEIYAANKPPAPAPDVPDGGPKAKEVYQNVKVLGDLSAGQFTRLMVAMTQWVAPEQGCNYCHNPENLADDSVYTKVVARRMIQMTQSVNADWKAHVGATGVTCYTCHRGKPVPNQVWFEPADRKYAANSIMGDLAGQNIASPTVAWSSLPNGVLSDYLKDAKPIRVNSNEALPVKGSAANATSTKQAEHTYGLMMHMSQSLGVNCTYCHNTQSFQSWEISPPQRATAWHGIRMARELNVDYMVPLTETFPKHRLGPKGDVAKVGCGTCHQGVFKPLYGEQMAKAHPELQAPIAGAPRDAVPAWIAAAAAPAAAAPAAAADGDKKDGDKK